MKQNSIVFTYSDWFGTMQNSVWCHINRKSVTMQSDFNVIKKDSDMIILRVYQMQYTYIHIYICLNCYFIKESYLNACQISFRIYCNVRNCIGFNITFESKLYITEIKLLLGHKIIMCINLFYNYRFKLSILYFMSINCC